MRTNQFHQNFDDYVLPSTDIFALPAERNHLNDSELLDVAERLTERCGEFGANGQVFNICPGPVVTTYEYKLDSGIKLNSIAGLADDLSLTLHTQPIRVEK
jgi:S-DNA-T family DNA segregation ATPase FtsK/SpoIIIE